ncbi:unnamed protein product [Peniophora sp. CBMAI 1063]|nr:unnamed protein product [Peniophora sp. CBMAI 1063]
MSRQHPPAISPVLRAGLGSRAQESVDGFLKALKLHTRRLSSVMEAHAAELGLLERLYYKGKNQHGASLLWGRVREMRRYVQRLRDLDLLVATQNLRAAFYGETTTASTKKLRGSWTHYPDSRYLTWLLRHLSTATELADKTATSMLRVFEWIMLFMQNGEFLQMTVTFSALAARFRHLSIQLRPLARLMHEDMRTVLVALYPEKAKNVSSLTAQQRTTAPMQSELMTQDEVTHADDHDMNIDEDLGVSVSRIQSMSDTVPIAPVSTSMTLDPHPIAKPPPVVHKAKPTISAPKGGGVITKKRKDAEPAPTPEPQKKVKKKKAKRDEIDDIFG